VVWTCDLTPDYVRINADYTLGDSLRLGLAGVLAFLLRPRLGGGFFPCFFMAFLSAFAFAVSAAGA